MIQTINQIYWDRINASYMSGTSLKKYPDETVKFKNELMPAGKTIIKWSSSLNYQSNKEVPRLPILQSGRSYQLVIDIDIKPINTAIFCLKFFDLQTTEINKIVFTEKEKQFVYPAEAVSYTFEIISGGCNEIKCRRLQLGNSNVPIEAFDDFYPVTISQLPNTKKVGLLLVADSKRARELNNNLVLPPSINFTLIIGYLSWQKSNLQLEKLSQFLNHYIDCNLILLSSSEKIDEFLQENESNFIYQNKVVLSKQLMKPQTHNIQNQWFKPGINSTDIQDAVNNTIEYFKE